MNELRKQGYVAERVRRWSGKRRRRLQLLGFADVVGVCAGRPPLAVRIVQNRLAEQVLATLAALPAVRYWLQGGCDLEVWTWSKAGHGWHLERSPLTTEFVLPNSTGPARRV